MMRVMHAQVMRNFILGSPLGIFCFNHVWGTGLSPHSAIPGLSLFRRNRFLIRNRIKGGTGWPSANCLPAIMSQFLFLANLREINAGLKPWTLLLMHS